MKSPHKIIVKINALKNFLAGALILIFAIFDCNASPGVTIRVDAGRGRNTIALGQNFYLQIEVHDMNEVPQQPDKVPGAKMLYFQRTGSSSSFSSINGKTTQSSSYIYTATMRAEKEGTFTYGPISVGGQKSNVIHYAIGKPMPDPTAPASSASPRAQNPTNGDSPQYIGKGDGNLFLKANVSKTSAYEQEALVYTVKLYSSYSAIKFIGATSAPKFDGFVIEESKDISTSLTFETYNGKQYATAIIARYIIFPQMKGNLKVIGNTYTVSVDEQEYYHDSYFGRIGVSRPLQLNVTPNDLNIQVKELPSPKPSDFTGAVGRFNIISSFPTKSLKTNNASSAVYTVSGTGNLKYVTLPDLNSLYPAQIEVFSPETDINATVGSSNVSGNVKFDYSLMPLETGTYTIPPVTLCYFNPTTAKYERTTAQGTTFIVEQGKGSSKSQSLLGVAFEPKLMPVEAALNASHIPLVYRFSYWLWYIIPILLLVGSMLYYRKHLKELADLTALRSKKASSTAQKRLKKAYKAMKSDNASLFYEESLKAIWGYLGDKLKIPTSELNRNNVSEMLANTEIDGKIISRSIDAIDDCEFARYSPVDQKQNMQDVYNRIATLISDIETGIKKKSQKKSTAQEHFENEEL